MAQAKHCSAVILARGKSRFRWTREFGQGTTCGAGPNKGNTTVHWTITVCRRYYLST